MSTAERDTALCLIATGKYTRFLPQIVRSVELHWPRAMPVVLTDDLSGASIDSPCHFRHWPHRPWPYPTLLRYHAMLAHADIFRQFPFMFYCDVDMRVNGPMEVYGEGRTGIDGELVGVKHPGFFGCHKAAGTFEDRRESRFYVNWEDSECYYAGGFQGGATMRYLSMAQTLSEMIDAELADGRIPRWHDESAANWYFVHNRPTVSLSPMYCMPESWVDASNTAARLLALDKNHAEMRREDTFAAACEYVGSQGEQWESVGRMQHQLLQHIGCRPESRVLEIGCGCLVLGHVLIDALNTGNYCGIDPNAWLRSVAIREKNLESLIAAKRPTFLSNVDFDASPHGSFDYVVSHSVLTHAGRSQLPLFFKNTAKALRPGGQLLASVGLGNRDTACEDWTYPDSVTYTQGTLIKTAAEYGLRPFDEQVEWAADVPEFRKAMMLTAPSHTHDWILFTKAAI